MPHLQILSQFLQSKESKFHLLYMAIEHVELMSECSLEHLHMVTERMSLGA